MTNVTTRYIRAPSYQNLRTHLGVTNESDADAELALHAARELLRLHVTLVVQSQHCDHAVNLGRH